MRRVACPVCGKHVKPRGLELHMKYAGCNKRRRWRKGLLVVSRDYGVLFVRDDFSAGLLRTILDSVERKLREEGKKRG